MSTTDQHMSTRSASDTSTRSASGPTDLQCEAAARALALRDAYDWDHLPPHAPRKATYRDAARAALMAAAAVRPTSSSEVRARR